MTSSDLTAFRRLCRQFRWLAKLMTLSVGLLLAGVYVMAPIWIGLRDAPSGQGREALAALIWNAPAICYLFGVWSIGRAVGQLAAGRLIEPTLASALRRVGLSLGVGGVFSVFVASNLLRMIGHQSGGYLYFDVPGMTLGMIGGALFLLGRVIDQAESVQAELDEMV